MMSATVGAKGGTLIRSMLMKIPVRMDNRQRFLYVCEANEDDNV